MRGSQMPGCLVRVLGRANVRPGRLVSGLTVLFTDSISSPWHSCSYTYAPGLRKPRTNSENDELNKPTDARMLYNSGLSDAFQPTANSQQTTTYVIKLASKAECREHCSSEGGIGCGMDGGLARQFSFPQKEAVKMARSYEDETASK